MDAVTRIERTLSASLERVDTTGGPPLLGAAMRHAVFPRGARIRSRLCLAVAAACREDDPDAADGAAAAIEFMHCASLVHDDLPCFDNADTRRGRPSVHRAFGEPLAVLAGDALIVLSFQTIAWGAARYPDRMASLILILAGATGMPSGIAAGQAWECEPTIDLGQYQRAKTGALFAAATMAGAAASGVGAASWRQLGESLGEAYQVADDIADVLSGESDLGKPTGQDAALGRPNAALAMGIDGAMRHLDLLAAAAAEFHSRLPGLRGIESPHPQRGSAAATQGSFAARGVMSGLALPWMSRDKSGDEIADRLFGLRNRMLADPRFQRWAAAFPLTRPIARRRARALFDVCAGFVYSQVLAACVRLRVFDALVDGPCALDALAVRLSLSPEAASRLLDAATALKLVERRGGGRFGLGVLGAAMVGNPGVSAMVEHHVLLYTDLRDPVALLRGERRDTELGQLWPYAGIGLPQELGADQVADYSRLMAASQPLVAADILAAYRLDRHRCLLDLGGGDGAFLCEAAMAAPDLKLMLFDLPAVADRARDQFACRGLSGRATAFGGDFRTEALPVGADIISLVRVVHDHNDDAALAILGAAWQALPEGGTLLLAEPMAETPHAAGVGAYFAFYLLAMGSGRPRRADELIALLHTAGFSDVRAVRTRRPMLVRILVASK